MPNDQKQKEDMKRQLTEALQKAAPQQGQDNLQGAANFAMPAAMWGPFVSILVDQIYNMFQTWLASELAKQAQKK